MRQQSFQKKEKKKKRKNTIFPFQMYSRSLILRHLTRILFSKEASNLDLVFKKMFAQLGLGFGLSFDQEELEFSKKADQVGFGQAQV